jgi:hypothetical protein
MELHPPKPTLKDTHALKGLRGTALMFAQLGQGEVFVDITLMAEHSQYISSTPMRKV